MNLQAEENLGFYLPHSLLCQYLGGTMGQLGHLQDQEEFSLPTGDLASLKRWPLLLSFSTALEWVLP